MPSGGIGGDLLAERYRLIDRVGAGGMSVVWRARDEVLDRLVAVKWLGAELADDDLFRDLIRREAWATARIKHPAVAAVYDYGEVPGRAGEARAYVVMEMLDGESLADRLRLGPVPWPVAVALAAEVADALATAHAHGVVHRDISPDNVMLTSSGPKVFDFGIAAPIGEPDDDATGSTFGTPAYVAPERLDGQPAQTATDVYAIGVLLFEMLTGGPPFPEDTWDPDAAREARAAPRPRGVAGLPAAVARLAQRCLAHDPADRPSAREVAHRLAGYARPWWRRRLALTAAAGLIVAAGIAVAFATGFSTGERPSALPPAASSTTDSTPPSTTTATGPPVASTPTPSAGGVSASAGGGPTSQGPATRTPSSPSPSAAGLPPDPVTPTEAINDLQGVITAGLDQDTIRTDVAQDLQNQVASIAAKLTLQPGASVGQMIDTLQTNVMIRSMEQWGASPGGGDEKRPPISAASKAALLAAIDQLRTALGLTA
jgi:serine/threonine protein kinase